SLTPLARSRPRAIAFAMFVRAMLKACNPHLGRIHPTSPLAAEEEFGLHAFSFHGAMFEAQWHVPRFASWCERPKLGEVYKEFYKLVQTVRWRQRAQHTSPQLLKAPQFMQELDDVLGVFPDARILWIQRELGEVLPSGASLVWNQQRIQSWYADPRRI